MSSLLSSPVVAQRIIQALDVTALWRATSLPPQTLRDSHYATRSGGMCGTTLHRSQWLSVTGPSMLIGAASLCRAVLAVIENEEAQEGGGDGEVGGEGVGGCGKGRRRDIREAGLDAGGDGDTLTATAGRLVQQTRLLRLLLDLLLFRPTKGRTARIGATPDPAYARSLLMEAEVWAKEAAGSLLLTLLRPRVLRRGQIEAAFERGMRAALLLLQPMYPPRLHYLGTSLITRLIARLVAQVPSGAHLERGEERGGTEEGRGEGTHKPQEPETRGEEREVGEVEGEGGGAMSKKMVAALEGKGAAAKAEIAIATRLLSIYDRVFSSTIGVLGGVVELEFQRHAVISSLGALLSFSCAAKEYCVSVGFVGVLVSSLDYHLRKLPLSRIEQKWNSVQKTSKMMASTSILRANVHKTPAFPRKGTSPASTAPGASVGEGGLWGLAMGTGCSRKSSVSTSFSFEEKEQRGETETQVLGLLNLISNALYNGGASYKKVFLDAGLAPLLRVLLLRPALQHHSKVAEPFLCAALKVLVNLLARSPEGTRAMAVCGADASVDHARPTSLLQLTMACCNMSDDKKGGRTLVTPLRPLQPLVPVQPVVMLDDSKDLREGRRPAEIVRHKPWLNNFLSVLASCASCSECMPVLLKSNVLPAAVTLLMAAADAKDDDAALSLLHFLVAMSRVELGQVAILKVKHILFTVSTTRLRLPHHAEIRRRCSLLFRNLSYCSEAKCHILSSTDAMAAIVQDLDASFSFNVATSAHCRAYAANAVWALLYNNQKAKAVIKTQQLALGGRTMLVLEWLVHEHEALQAELGSDSGNMVQGWRSKEWQMCVKEGINAGDRKALLECALKSLRAALALTLD